MPTMPHGCNARSWLPGGGPPRRGRRLAAVLSGLALGRRAPGRRTSASPPRVLLALGLGRAAAGRAAGSRRRRARRGKLKVIQGGKPRYDLEPRRLDGQPAILM